MHCQADACGTGGRNGNDLVYVGAGQGEFAVEPQMKYVGYGGDYSVRRGGFNVCLVLGPALACLLALLCYIFWPVEECLDRKAEYLYHWSPDKTMRCCARGFVACPQQPTIPPPSGPVDPYNCAEGILNFGAEWSLEKKQWCCNQHGKGCGQDAEVPAAQYDCNSAFANWVKGWSPGKKQWCCSKGIKCCPSDAAAAGAGYGAGTKHGADFHGAPVATFNVIPFSQTRGR